MSDIDAGMAYPDRLLMIPQITGVSGYIGFKTLRMALQQNYKVRAIVRKHEQAAALKSHSRIAELLDDLEFMVVPDMARAGAFDSVLDGVSVLHLASPLAKEVRFKTIVSSMRRN